VIWRAHCAASCARQLRRPSGHATTQQRRWSSATGRLTVNRLPTAKAQWHKQSTLHKAAPQGSPDSSAARCWKHQPQNVYATQPPATQRHSHTAGEPHECCSHTTYAAAGVSCGPGGSCAAHAGQTAARRLSTSGTHTAASGKRMSLHCCHVALSASLVCATRLAPPQAECRPVEQSICCTTARRAQG
jgi:hypothetical protein